MTTQKITVTYKAPPGDAKVTEAFGHTFHDGKPEEIEVDEHTADKIRNNPCFMIGGEPKTSEPAKKEKGA
jgi:hypothetical protein